MIKNYLKIAWRNLQSRKTYTAINIIGLAVGLAACLLIGLYVQDELSYDEFHSQSDRTYRVLREFDIPDLHTTIATTPSALAPTMSQALSGVERAVRVQKGNPVIQYRDKKFVENSFISADEGFFTMFSFPLTRGEALLGRPSTILITKAMGTKYFGDENPIGKSLQVGSRELEVTGIMAEVPHNSHLQFDFVASLDDPAAGWGRNNFSTYITLNNSEEKGAVTSQMADLIQTNVGSPRTGNAFIPHLQPITGIHLGQGVSVDISSEGNILYAYLLIILAVFIVLLACINYMNLATARSMERAREVGMRKTLGAGRLQIAMQFIGESILVASCAFIFAVALCQMFLPIFNDLAGRSLELSTFYNGQALLMILGLVLLVGIGAGIYPAVVLSSFPPSRVVKGMLPSGVSNRFRKVLVVFQFAISTALLVCTGIVYQQLQYMKSAGLGFNADNVVLIKQVNFLGNQVETVKRELAKVSGVEDVASGYSVPGTFFLNSMWQTADEEGNTQNMNYSFVDFNYVETLDIEMIAGRSMSAKYASDSTAVLLNETAARKYGWSPNEAVGKQLIRGQQEYTIVGVAKDFHYGSLHSEIHPLALFGPQRPPQYLAVRLASDNIGSSLTNLQQVWESFSGLPFEYTFLAENLSAQYRSEARLAKVFGVFAILAIIIGCMGLFGLAAFMASKRTKEIGIRKVLGATTTSIIGLLNKEFLKLVLLGFLIAVPVTWFVMRQWLADFAYRIDIGPGIFLLAGSVAILIAIATVSWRTLSVALTDPVKSLRSE